MTMFIIQSLLLMAIAYILGCIIGCLLRQLLGTAEEVAPAPVAAPIVKEERKAVPPAPKPKPEPKPKTESKPVPVAPVVTPTPPVQKDDLKRIRGIGPQNEARLNDVGIMAFAQIAGWSAKDQREMGERLAFPGRIEREEWVKQAKTLAKGEETNFSKRVDKGEVGSSVGKAKASELGTKPPVMSSAPANGGDNLTLIDGVGNAIEKKLFAMGIYTFEQVSKWNKSQQVWIGNELGFPGRPERENWVGEAKKLAKGEMTDHAKRVERGEITSSRKTDK